MSGEDIPPVTTQHAAPWLSWDRLSPSTRHLLSAFKLRPLQSHLCLREGWSWGHRATAVSLPAHPGSL